MTRKIELGPLCAALSKQLAGLVSAEDAELLDNHHNAINHCYVCGFISETIFRRAHKKLMAKGQKAVSRFADAKRSVPSVPPLVPSV